LRFAIREAATPSARRRQEILSKDKKKKHDKATKLNSFEKRLTTHPGPVHAGNCGNAKGTGADVPARYSAHHDQPMTWLVRRTWTRSPRTVENAAPQALIDF